MEIKWQCSAQSIREALLLTFSKLVPKPEALLLCNLSRQPQTIFKTNGRNKMKTKVQNDAKILQLALITAPLCISTDS